MKRLVTFFVSLFLMQVNAQDNLLKSTLKGSSSSSDIKDYVYDGQQWLSDQLVSFSNGLDSLFGEKGSLLEQNGTRVHLFNVWRNERGVDPSQEVFFDLDLRLPNLKRKLRFNLEKRADTETEENLSREKRISQQEAIQNDDDVRAGISYLLDDIRKFKLKLSGGLRLSQSVVPYLRFRINRDFEIGEGSLNFFTQSYWDQTQEMNQNFRLNYTYRLTDDLNFIFVNDGTWFQSSSETLVTQGPTLHHRLSDRRDIIYSVRANSSSKPQYELDSYYAGITYRQRVMKSWFFYELTPYITFPRNTNFKKVEGILFTLQATIGSL